MATKRRRSGTAGEPERFVDIGVTGLKVEGGRVAEEWNAKLRDRRGVLAYREMAEQEPIVVTALHHIEMGVERVPWHLDTAPGHEEDPAAVAARDFVESCILDLESPLSAVASDAARGMITFGSQLNEVVYKVRGGPDAEDPTRRSAHSDGRIGWRRFAVRAQETIAEWVFDDDQQPVAAVQRIESGDYAGTYEIPLSRALLFRYRPAKNNPEGRSALRGCWSPYFFLKRFREAEAIGADRDHTGMAIFELPAEYLSAGADDAMVAVRNYVAKVIKSMAAGERSGALLPSPRDADGKDTGFNFRVVGSPGQKVVNADNVIRRYEGALAMVLINEFALLGRDGVGSWALDDGKQTRFGLFLDGLLTIIRAELQVEIKRLCKLNGFRPEHTPVLRFGSVRAPDLTALSQYLVAAHQVDLLDPDDRLRDWVREVAKLPARQRDIDPQTGEPMPYARDSGVAELQAAVRTALDAGDLEMANVLRRALARLLDAEMPADLVPGDT